MIKKFILASPDADIYNDPLHFKRTPVIKVCGNKIIQPEEIDLGGLSIENWLEQNPTRLKYTITLNILSNEPIEYQEKNYYNPDWELIEIPLDDNETFIIKERNSSSDFFADIRQLDMLIKGTNETFNFIEPIEPHKDVYGLAYREIILLSAMEVENQWKSFLTRNGYESARPSTNDYVKLNEFINFNVPISLSYHPDYPTLLSFSNWSSDAPTESLEWYNAYNKIKHNRTENFQLATLNNALLSVSAVITVISLRYGIEDVKKHLSNSTFKIPDGIIYSKFGCLRDIGDTTAVKYFE
jgi:hypothetical protein